jgi:enoyl-CoA hydratase
MPHDSLHTPSLTQSRAADDLKVRFQIEDRGAILIVRVDGGPHALFGPEIANQLDELVDRVDHDPRVHSVVFTGAHPTRFISHADVCWLQ